MEKTLSIIIPTYNVSRYIVGTLKGLLSQDCDDFVVYIVDDCSKDDTVSLIRQHFAAELSSGKIDLALLDENSGSAVARQHALERVTTPFVTFLDADDNYSSSHAVATMCEAVKAEEADFYMFGYFTYHGRVKLKKQERLPHLMSAREAMIRKICGGHPIWNYLWNKVYRMSVVRDHNVTFVASERRAQEVRFNEDFLPKARNVCYINKLLYVYNCTNPGSISKRKSSVPFGREQFLARWQRINEQYYRLMSNASALGCAEECENPLRRSFCSMMVSSLAQIEDVAVRKGVEEEIASSKLYVAMRPLMRKERIRLVWKGFTGSLRNAAKKLLK